MHPWENVLGELDRKVIAAAGYGKERPLGKAPVLLVIDAQYNYVGEDLPILESIGQYPTSVGRLAYQALPQMLGLVHAFREKKRPVFFTTVAPKESLLPFSISVRIHADRRQETLVAGHKGTEIIEALRPEPGELVVDKAFASAFMGTPLATILTLQHADTVIVCGGTTSGCVRGTAVDAAGLGYNVVVAEDAVFDRIQLSHAASLLDLWMKYANVFPAQRVVDWVRSLP
ncbi:MAG: cysteine hydrolase family protein [Thermoplasmata archaeon]